MDNRAKRIGRDSRGIHIRKYEASPKRGTARDVFVGCSLSTRESFRGPGSRPEEDRHRRLASFLSACTSSYTYVPTHHISTITTARASFTLLAEYVIYTREPRAKGWVVSHRPHSRHPIDNQGRSSRTHGPHRRLDSDKVALSAHTPRERRVRHWHHCCVPQTKRWLKAKGDEGISVRAPCTRRVTAEGRGQAANALRCGRTVVQDSHQHQSFSEQQVGSLLAPLFPPRHIRFSPFLISLCRPLATVVCTSP